MDTKLVAVVGDITTMKVDAIVNAAKPSLRGGGGVDGAIHRAAGPMLLKACVALYPDGICTGEAVFTGGYQLPAAHVIHTVGPVWDDYTPAEADFLLAKCYRCSVHVAARLGVETLAFPAISTGIYGFPQERAAKIAVKTVTECLAQETHNLKQITFVCFDQGTLDLYNKELA